MSNHLLTRYIIGYVLKTCAQIFLVLFFILAGNQSLLLLGKAKEFGISNPSEFILLSSLDYLPLLLSLSLFLAIIIVLSRFYKNHEMSAIKSTGIGIKQLIIMMQWLAIPIALIVAVLHFNVNPWSKLAVEKIKNIAKTLPEKIDISANKFHYFSKGSAVLYAKKVADGGASMQSVFLQFKQNNQTVFISANKGRIDYNNKTGESKLWLSNGGHRVSIQDKKVNQLKFSTYDLPLREGVGTLTTEAELIKNNIRAQDFGYLLSANNKEAKAEFYRRLSEPVVVILLSILAVLLSKTPLRDSGMGKNILLGIIAFMLYRNLILIAKDEMLDGGINILWVNLLVAALIYWLYRRQQNA